MHGIQLTIWSKKGQKKISFEHCVTVIVLQPATRGRSNRFGVTKFMLHQANSSESSSFNMAGNYQRPNLINFQNLFLKKIYKSFPWSIFGIQQLANTWQHLLKWEVRCCKSWNFNQESRSLTWFPLSLWVVTAAAVFVGCPDVCVLVLADFGLAKQKQENSKLTSVVGTILYSWWGESIQP